MARAEAYLHVKFHFDPSNHVWKYGRHPISEAEIRRGNKKKKKETG